MLSVLCVLGFKCCMFEIKVYSKQKYSGFLLVVPTNTGIFLRGLKLYGESRTYQVLLVPKKKIGGNRTFFRDNNASIRKETPCIALYFTTFLINVA